MLTEARNRAEIEMLILKNESELSKFKLYYEYLETFKNVLKRIRELL